MAGPNNINVTLSMKTSEFSKGLAKAKAETKSFGYEMGRAFGRAPQMAAKALAAGVVAGSVAMVYGSKKAFELGAGLKHLSDRTGIAVDSLAVMQQQFRDGGVDADSLAGSVNKLQRNLVDAARTGSGPAAQALAIFGENAEDLMRLDPAEYFKRVGTDIASIKNPAVQASAAIALFGKQGAQLLPMFKGEGFGEAAGVIGGQAQILKKNADLFLDVNNRLTHAGVKLQGFFVGFASKIAPGLDEWLRKLDREDFAQKGQKFGEFIADAADKLKAGFDSVYPAMAFMVKAQMQVLKMSRDGVAGAAQWAGGIEANLEQAFKELGSGLKSGASMSQIFGNVFSAAKHPATPESKPTMMDEVTVSAAPTNFWNRHGNGAGTDDETGRDPRGGRIFRGSAPMRPGWHAPLLPQYAMERTGFKDTLSPASSSLRSGGLTSGNLNSGAYNQSPLLKHSEMMKAGDAQLAQLIAAGASPADIAKAADARSNSGGHDVVRRGDHNRARALQREEQRKAMTLEGTNSRLDTIIDINRSTWQQQGGGASK